MVVVEANNARARWWTGDRIAGLGYSLQTKQRSQQTGSTVRMRGDKREEKRNRIKRECEADVLAGLTCRITERYREHNVE